MPTIFNVGSSKQNYTKEEIANTIGDLTEKLLLQTMKKKEITWWTLQKSKKNWDLLLLIHFRME